MSRASGVTDRTRVRAGACGCRDHNEAGGDDALHFGDATIHATMTDRQIAWTALDKGTTVLASDGEELGKVSEVVADAQKDIFSGIVITPGLLGSNLFAPASLIEEITDGAVKLTLSGAAAQEELEPPA
jgi:sporulation protein YlmC with PRC-barrel domain